MKIAVVGIGGTGSATARHLAKRGHEVTGYERFQIGHTNGSSHGESRIIRYTYPDALFTGLMRDAYREWDALETEAGEELFVRCGGLTFGPPDHPEVRSIEQSLLENHVPYDRLEAHQSHDRFPELRLKRGEIALFQRDGGFLRAARCVQANARLARNDGAQLYEETTVTKITQLGRSVRVQTNTGQEETFDRVIVTAGAWMGQLLSDLRLPLTVTQQQVVYLEIAQNAAAFEPKNFSVWIDAGTYYYGFPSDGQIPGIKLARHFPGKPTDPNNLHRPSDDDYTNAAITYAAERMPHLSSHVTWSQTCLYTNTPNEDFIIDRVPDMPRVSLVSGCSGHGFKFTVLLGKIAADMATDIPTSYNLSRFTLASFSK